MMRRILTRETAATNTKLTTLAQLKSELGETGTDKDALYSRVIDYCSNEISVWLNPDSDEVGDATIGREVLSETFYGVSGQNELVLGRRPVGDVTSITEDGTTIARLIDDEPNPAFTYLVKKSSGLIWKMSGNALVPFSASQIKVIYSAGWILPADEGRTLPMTIEDACLRFCLVKLDQIREGEDLAGPLTGASIEGVGNFQFGGQVSHKGRGLPYEVRNLIERYKTPTMA